MNRVLSPQTEQTPIKVNGFCTGGVRTRPADGVLGSVGLWCYDDEGAAGIKALVAQCAEAGVDQVAQYLLRHCWKSQLTISLPRLRPCAGEFEPLTDFNDRNLVQAICALRLFLPDSGIVLSTREPASLRDRLIPLGITMMSAGSHTEPGGYTGAGSDDLHLTVRGRRVELESRSGCEKATEQFQIHDTRSANEISAMLRAQTIDPVWKDWDEALLAAK